MSTLSATDHGNLRSMGIKIISGSNNEISSIINMNTKGLQLLLNFVYSRLGTGVLQELNKRFLKELSKYRPDINNTHSLCCQAIPFRDKSSQVSYGYTFYLMKSTDNCALFLGPSGSISSSIELKGFQTPFKIKSDVQCYIQLTDDQVGMLERGEVLVENSLGSPV